MSSYVRFRSKACEVLKLNVCVGGSVRGREGGGGGAEIEVQREGEREKDRHREVERESAVQEFI